MSVRTLALHAQRLGRVFVSAGTWLRFIRERGWRRPRTRVHPASPKQGVRATKPNEYWHIDVTIIKLLDGTKVYIHAVIDNLSRRILAWKVALRLEPQNTCAVLVEAGKTLPPEEDPATVVADSGVETSMVPSMPFLVSLAYAGCLPRSKVGRPCRPTCPAPS
jgi:transposase InsO family protein